MISDLSRIHIWPTPHRRLALVILCSGLLMFSTGDAWARKNKKDLKEAPSSTSVSPGPATTSAPSGETGTVEVDVSNITGLSLPSRVRLFPYDDRPETDIEAPNGKGEGPAGVGKYRAYIYVLQDDVPVLVDAQDVTVSAGKSTYVLVNLLEGSSGKLGVRAFDFDGDLAIDSVELKCGTNKEDAASVPGKPLLPWDDRILQNEMRWYRGELVTHSEYGGGSESVAKLIERAEKSGLDFLAITDRNTLKSIYDSGYHSDKLVLIPAMEWGNDSLGYAYIYGPRTAPELTTLQGAAQAECIRVQAQGGVFAVAHPCLPSAPWLWGLSYVNAVNVWYQGWKDNGEFHLSQLSEDMKIRDKGRLVHSIAAAAARADLEKTCSNDQSTLFWDYEMTRGLMAAAIGGSGSTGPKEPLGRPLTYVKAKTKSLPGILEGLRLGYTYISNGLDGPQLFFQGDVLGDKKVDVSIGGIVPTGVETIFQAGVKGAAGGKLQVLQDGRVILSKSIEGDTFMTRFPVTPPSFSAFRIRVLSAPGGGGKSGKHKKDDGGDVSLETPEVLAMSSPIYAQDITKELLQQVPNLDVDKLWVRVQDKNANVIGPGIEELDGKVAPQQKPGTAPPAAAPQQP